MEQGPVEQAPLAEFAEAGEHSLEGALSRTGGRRRRVGQVALGAVALLAVAVALVAYAPGGNGAPWLAAATAVPTVQPIYVNVGTNVNYGTVTVNGVRQPVQKFATPVTLNRRVNVVRLDAPPFAPIVCHIPGGRLDLKSTGRCGVNGSVNMLDFTFTMGDLPQTLQETTRLALKQQLAQFTQEFPIPVTVGDHYATSFGAYGKPVVARAQTPLVGYLDLSNILMCGEDPDTSCAITGGSVAPEGHAWQMVFSDQAAWRYVNAAGTMASVAPMGSSGPYALTVPITDDGQITVAGGDFGTFQTRLEDDLCNMGENAIYTDLVANTESSTSNGFEGMQGCAVDYTAPSAGRFIVRLGVALAVDAGAHKLAPDLPMATADEIAAVSH